MVTMFTVATQCNLSIALHIHLIFAESICKTYTINIHNDKMIPVSLL